MNPFISRIEDRFNSDERVVASANVDCNFIFLSHKDFSNFDKNLAGLGYKKRAAAGETVDYRFPSGGIWHIIAEAEPHIFQIPTISLARHQ